MSVQDNAKSKLKKRDQAESVVKEQNIKKEPEAVTSVSENEKILNRAGSRTLPIRD